MHHKRRRQKPTSHKKYIRDRKLRRDGSGAVRVRAKNPRERLRE